MFEKLEVMRMAHAMAAHAGKRQTVVAQNVANADSPGYRARDLEAFSNVYDRPLIALKKTREGHLSGDAPSIAPVIDATQTQKPNGNSVSIEAQMLKAGEIRHQHDMALSIYKTSLDILRMSVARR